MIDQLRERDGNMVSRSKPDNRVGQAARLKLPIYFKVTVVIVAAMMALVV